MKIFKIGQPIKDGYRRIMVINEGDKDNPKERNITLADLLLNLVKVVEMSGKMTAKDSVHARRLVSQCLDAAKTKLEIEESEHDWAKEKAGSDLIANAMGMTASVIKDLLDEFERKEDKKEDKGDN